MNSSSLVEHNYILNIPDSPGAYILQLGLFQPRSLVIGKLGRYHFPPGEYFYIGSALGPGGLRARLGRHLRGSSKRHWHIDWFAPVCSINGYFYSTTRLRLECIWSQLLIQQPTAQIPVPGFGAGDCENKPTACSAHLVSFENMFDMGFLCKNLPVPEGNQIDYQEIIPHFLPDNGDIE